MPKFKSPRHDPRPVRKRLFIVCEGEKTERFYFEEFIKSCGFRGMQVEVKVLKSKRTTPCELIETAIKKCRMNEKSRKYLEDEIWVVYDKNGYTKHCEADTLARQKKINVAFSSISFEFWILLNFEETTRKFTNSKEIIDYLKKKYLDYDKTNPKLYDDIKDRTEDAFKRAENIRKVQKQNCPNKKRYELNPYTNVDE